MPKETWAKWDCPHPDCEDGREYEDPDTVFETTCDKGHQVMLIWSVGDDRITPILAEDVLTWSGA